MSTEDYYSLLGLGRDADQNEIKKAYRKLAMEYHPDRNPDDKKAEEKFKAISEAYAILSDPQKRAEYDRFGKAGARGTSGGFSSYGGFSGDPFDIFESIFVRGFQNLPVSWRHIYALFYFGWLENFKGVFVA